MQLSDRHRPCETRSLPAGGGGPPPPFAPCRARPPRAAPEASRPPRDSQLVPRQLRARKSSVDQSWLFHAVPLHEVPVHWAACSCLLSHLVPVQVLPFQAPLTHAESRPSAFTHEAACQAEPSASTSPVRATPVCGSTTCSPPRDASSDPRPVELRAGVADTVGTRLALTWATALPTSVTPAPCAGFAVARGRAVVSSSAFTWSGVSLGSALKRRAASPEATAAACEVPL